MAGLVPATHDFYCWRHIMRWPRKWDTHIPGKAMKLKKLGGLGAFVVKQSSNQTSQPGR
jgi:hypothetical protein